MEGRTYQNLEKCRFPESHKIVTICFRLPSQPLALINLRHTTKFTAAEEPKKRPSCVAK